MKRPLLGLILPAALLTLWELSTRDLVDSFLIAAPSQIVLAVVEEIESGRLIAAVGQTLYTTSGGLLIGGTLGLVLGIVTGLITPLARLLAVTFESLRSIPSIVLIPISLIIFGFGPKLEIAIISFATFWPMLILSQGAVSQVEPRLIEVSRILGLGLLRRVWLIVLPASLPFLFLAFRLAVASGIITAITVEIAGNPRGLGYELMQAQQFLQPASMFSYLLAVGILGWAINAILLWTETRLFPSALNEIASKSA